MLKLKIKTSCGIEKYQKLKSNKTIIGKIRFYWFVTIASLRDIVFNRAPKIDQKMADEN